MLLGEGVPSKGVLYNNYGKKRFKNHLLFVFVLAICGNEEGNIFVFDLSSRGGNMRNNSSSKINNNHNHHEFDSDCNFQTQELMVYYFLIFF